VLAAGSGCAGSLSDRLAAVIAIQDRWDCGARRIGVSARRHTVAVPAVERAFPAGINVGVARIFLSEPTHIAVDSSRSFSIMNAQPTPQDPFHQFKQSQKQGWAYFSPLESLDVGCGTGVAAITAAKLGAHATGMDLTPELLQRARENGRISEVSVDWREADAENLPFDDGAFDVVVSQFGHIFAPRPEVATAEMLRVLKPGGTIAFSSWPPEGHVGRSSALIAKYLPSPPGVPSPALWGEPRVIQERLGSKVKDIVFDRARMMVPVLSVQLHRANSERVIGPLIKLVEALSASDPDKLAQFRAEAEALTLEYVEGNILRQDYLLTRATKI
jgi:SAM-dependent methyltransferase